MNTQVMEPLQEQLPTYRQYLYLRYTLAHYGGAMSQQQKEKVEYCLTYGTKGSATLLIRSIIPWRAEQDALLD